MTLHVTRSGARCALFKGVCNPKPGSGVEKGPSTVRADPHNRKRDTTHVTGVSTDNSCVVRRQKDGGMIEALGAS